MGCFQSQPKSAKQIRREKRMARLEQKRKEKAAEPRTEEQKAKGYTVYIF